LRFDVTNRIKFMGFLNNFATFPFKTAFQPEERTAKRHSRQMIIKSSDLAGLVSSSKTEGDRHRAPEQQKTWSHLRR
jgi:hypothetical protein